MISTQAGYGEMSAEAPDLIALREGYEVLEQRACWTWFTENREALDELFDELVKGRDKMARLLGFKDFVAMGYERKRRVDYDRTDVECFRKQVRELLVPLCSRLAERQARDLGVDTLKLWDERAFSPAGSPMPRGGHDWMIERASEMFADLSPSLSELFQAMVTRGLLGLRSRRGKTVGGFCAYLYEYQAPFVFANFNGTHGDVRVFTHEMGHTFQRWSSSKCRSWTTPAARLSLLKFTR